MLKEEARFFKADVQKLQECIDSTGKSKAAIVKEAEFGIDLLAKALKGWRIRRSKANAICIRLNACKCTPKAEMANLFSPVIETN